MTIALTLGATTSSVAASHLHALPAASVDATTPVASRKNLKRKVNVSVKDADVRSVLTFLAREARTNVVMSPAVRGKVTMYLQGVTVSAALTAVLKVQGLDMISRDNVLLVMTRKEMMDYLQHERWRGRR